MQLNPFSLRLVLRGHESARVEVEVRWGRLERLVAVLILIARVILVIGAVRLVSPIVAVTGVRGVGGR